MKDLRIAVVGATGAVGKELLRILEQRHFPVGELVPFASPRSEGKELAFKGRSFRCRALRPDCFKGVDIAFFDASDAISKEWVPQAAESGAWVVDNSATFRLEDDVLLLVPEINGELLRERLQSRKAAGPRSRILSGPNCSTVQMMMALRPIQKRWGLKRVVVSTYQSTSGAGAAAMEELSAQTQALLQQKHLQPRIFQHPIAFNCIPQIGGFKEDGYTSEEHKMIAESRKLLSEPQLRMSATAIRVPTLSCHAESINVETVEPLDLEQVRRALESQPGVIVQDEPGDKVYPMGIAASGKDAVFVGRIRRDPSIDNGLNLWVVSDNLRKGAALNAVQIGEILVQARS